MLSNCNRPFVKVKNSVTGRTYIIPKECIKLIKEKSKSLSKVFLQIGKVVVET